MPYRELIMIDIKEMLRRRAAGQSERRVARETRFDRKTVGRYFAAAEALSLSREREPTEEEVLAVAGRVQARPVTDPSEEWKQVAGHRERVATWLASKRPLKLQKIHTLLQRDHGVTASYDTLRRFAIEELGWRKKPTTVRLAEMEPGEIAQVDFGLMGTLVDPTTGRARRLWVLIVTLVYSRYQFVCPSFEQTTEAVCAGLDAAWWFFGAMARVLLPDNMSAMVQRADELGPTLVPRVPRLRAGARTVRRRGAGQVPEGQGAGGESSVLRARELVRRRDLHEPRGRTRGGRALVPRRSWSPCPRHDVRGAQGGVRGSREAGDEVPSLRALRRASLGRRQGPSRSPRAGPEVALQHADALRRQHGARPRRSRDREDLRRQRAGEDVRARRAGASG